MCIQDLSKNKRSFHKRLEKGKKNTHTTHTPAHHPQTGTNAAYTSTPSPILHPVPDFWGSGRLCAPDSQVGQTGRQGEGHPKVLLIFQSKVWVR